MTMSGGANIGFSYEIIRDYLLSEGGKVEYHKLIKHFKDALANPENKEARVLFKDLVNQVAVVTTEGNQKYLSLRQKPLSTSISEEPPRLPPRSTSNDPINHHDSKTNLNYQSTVNHKPQYYDAQNKMSNQQHYTQMDSQMSNQTKLINQSTPHQQNPYGIHHQINYSQSFSRLHPNMDPMMINGPLSMSNHQQMSQIKSNYHISDTQPRQPFSYNLSQPVPAFLNQRIHPVDTNNMDSVLIQPKPVPTIPQMPSLPNMMNSGLMMNLNQNLNTRFTNKNSISIDQHQQPPLPTKNQWGNPNNTDCPPKAPPRRKSFANGSNTYLNKKGSTNQVKDNENFLHSIPKQFTDKIKEINELKFNSPGRVKEHAKKLNKMVSESELKLPMPLGMNNGMNANFPNNFRDDSDLNDHVKRRWMVKSSSCDYYELQQMLKDYPKLAEFRDITSGYNALHWAAKFNKSDIIKLIAGTHGVNPNIKTSGYTPCHLAAMFGHKEIMDLLVKGYNADSTIRDYSGMTANDLMRINNKKILDQFSENNAPRKNQETETKTSSLLARTASLRQTHKQLLDRLPKYRTMK